MKCKLDQCVSNRGLRTSVCGTAKGSHLPASIGAFTTQILLNLNEEIFKVS